jgi:hypothetical protein
LAKGIYTLEDMKQVGRENKLCPYYLTKIMLAEADIIVMNHCYMLDPKLKHVV